MIYIYVRQTVLHYPVWKEALDSHLAARQAGGATAEVLIFRNVDDPNEIVVLLGWTDLKQARLFQRSVSWQMVLREMRVVGSPTVCFWEQVS